MHLDNLKEMKIAKIHTVRDGEFFTRVNEYEEN